MGCQASKSAVNPLTLPFDPVGPEEIRLRFRELRIKTVAARRNQQPQQPQPPPQYEAPKEGYTDNAEGGHGSNKNGHAHGSTCQAEAVNNSRAVTGADQDDGEQLPPISGHHAAFSAAIILVGSLNVPDDPAASFHSWAPGRKCVSLEVGAEAPSKSSDPLEVAAELQLCLSPDCVAQNPRLALPSSRQMHRRNIERLDKFNNWLREPDFANAVKEEISIRLSNDAELLKVDLPPGEPF